MRVNGFGAYPVRNVSSGGQKNSVDEFNKSLKGDAYSRYEEYISRQVEEYHLYSEYNDFTSKQQDQENGSSQSDDRKKRNARAQRQRMLQQVVGLVAGSVVVVTSYQAVLKQQAEAVVEPTSVSQSADAGDYDPSDYSAVDNVDPAEETTQEATTQPEQNEAATGSDGEQASSNQDRDQAVTTPAGFLTSWSWSGDNKSATLKITDTRGNVIREIPAAVTVVQKAATCKKDGSVEYKATAVDDAKTYSNSKSEKISALGHAFGEGKEVILDNGQTAMTFECSRCHETFTIQTTITEND